MTDFDKLIKEKAEEATYSYKPSAWKSFQKKAGTYRSPLKYWAMGAAVTMIAGASLVVVLRQNNVSPQSPIHDLAAQDTVMSVQADETTVLVRESDVAETTGKTVSHNPKSVDKSAGTVASEQPNTIESSQQKPSVERKSTVTRQPIGRPLVIDVDTIKENVPSDEELRKGNSRIF